MYGPPRCRREAPGGRLRSEVRARSEIEKAGGLVVRDVNRVWRVGPAPLFKDSMKAKRLRPDNKLAKELQKAQKGESEGFSGP